MKKTILLLLAGISMISGSSLIFDIPVFADDLSETSYDVLMSEGDILGAYEDDDYIEDDDDYIEDDYIEDDDGDGIPDESDTYFDVKDFGADGSDNDDDRYAINRALSKGADRSDKITVNIPDGNYYISGSLYIYSNTTLQLGKNTVIYQMSEYLFGPMIIGAHLDEGGSMCKCSAGASDVKCQGYEYSKYGDITIDGGKWIAYKNPDTKESLGSTIVAFRHAHDITIKNMSCKNASGHAMNLSGVNNAYVYNVKFENAIAKSGETDKDLFTKEFLHLDYCTKVGEPSYGIPYDGTCAKNITIEKCTFTNGYSGLGNHHPVPSQGKISSNIKVKNCTFKNLEAYVVGEFSVNGLTVEKCKSTNCMILALISDSSDIKLLNNTFNAKGSHKFDNVYEDRGGINITQSKKINIKGNTVKNTTNSSISVTRSTNINIKSNKCSGAGKDGIAIKGAKSGTISSNKVTSAKSHGIEYRSTTGMTISKNNLTSTDDCLFIIGGEKTGYSKVKALKNIVNSKKGYDVFLGPCSDGSYFSGNTLKNHRRLTMSSYKGSI